jgi:hypothetical protein
MADMLLESTPDVGTVGYLGAVAEWFQVMSFLSKGLEQLEWDVIGAGPGQQLDTGEK